MHKMWFSEDTMKFPFFFYGVIYRMPLVSFSVPGQKPKILDGRKRQTMRHPRKPGSQYIHSGDKLFLWWKSRSRTEKEFLGETVCVKKRLVNLAAVWNDEENAIADGFANLTEFRDWFVGGWENAEETELKAYLELAEFDIIEWRYPLIKQTRLEMK